MDGYEMKALHNCHHNLLQDLEPDKAFLSSLLHAKVITEDQKDEIEHEATRRGKVSRILEILPRRGPRAFEDFVRLLKLDYNWLSDKLEKELIKERTYLSRDINDKLSQVVNHQLCVLVYGHNRHVTTPNSSHPLSTVSKLSEVLHYFHQRCVRALELPTKDTFISESLPSLIDKKIQEMHDIILELRTELADLKKQNRKRDENKLSKETNGLRKEIKKLKDGIKKYENNLKNKDKKLRDMEKENDLLKLKIKDMEKREQDLSNGNTTICEMFLTDNAFR